MTTEPKNWASEFPRYSDFQRFQAAAATESLHWDLTAFNALLQDLVRVGEDMERELLKIALEIERRVAMRTPVRTGRARNSWHTIPPNSQDSYVYSDDLGHSFDGALGEATGPLEAIVGTNVEYMISLEAGHSRQAPHGMLGITLAEFQGAFQARLAAIIQRLGEGG